MGLSISGLARSGKDTLGDYACEHAGFYKDHFAFDLKNIAEKYFNWDGEKDDRGRHLLQLLGTEVGRNYFQEIWLCLFATRNDLIHPDGEVLPRELLSKDMQREISMSLKAEYGAALEKGDKTAESRSKAALIAFYRFGWDGKKDARGEELLTNIEVLACGYDADYWSNARLDTKELNLEESEEGKSKDFSKDPRFLVVPDTRFPNELHFLRFNGFETIKVERKGLVKMGHASETSLDNETFDHVIENNESLESYLKKVQGVVFAHVRRME